MLTSLRLVNFKNFADETLKLGPFTVIVGANASGKSNIRDAFRFLHGIGRGYTMAEIMGGKVGAGGLLEWDGIRGAANEIVRLIPKYPVGVGDFTIRVTGEHFGSWLDYSITAGFNPDSSGGFRVFRERLVGDTGLSSYEAAIDPLQEWRPVSNRVSTFLTNFSEDHDSDNDDEKTLHYMLEKLRFLEPVPTRTREPSIPGATTLGDYGQNLPSVLEPICVDPDRKHVLTSWLQELTPMDVQDFEFPRDPSGRVHLYIVERNGRKVSAYSASDGTLRFLVILTLLLSEDASGTYIFEDIDSGIHPNRLWLLLELIEKQTAKGNIQVVTTTHNPALLAWMNDTTFQHTSVVWRDEYASDSIIRPIADLYNLRELRKSQGLARLFTGGWLESAMKASEGAYDTDHIDDAEEDEREMKAE